MIGLLDVNVLVALVDIDHMHHERALDWLEQDGVRTGWATCLITQLGAIRVCAVASVQWPPRESAERVQLLCREHARHRWWPDLMPPTTMREVREAVTANQVPDRYLLGFARQNGARLVTFDRGIKRMGGDDVICLAPDAPELRERVGGGRSSGLWAVASVGVARALTGCQEMM